MSRVFKPARVTVTGSHGYGCGLENYNPRKTRTRVKGLTEDPRLLRLNPDAGPNKFWEKKGLMPDLVRTFGVKFGVQA
jgi:hypothetical protein